MERFINYCNSSDVIVSKSFSQQSMIVWSRERVEELSCLPLTEQFKQRRIRQIVVKSPLSAQALLVPDTHQDSFSLMINFEYPLEWPMCVGHELAHTYFFKKGSSGLYYRVNRTRGPRAIEEEICEVFAKMWMSENENHLELSQFLDPIASKGGVIDIF